MCGVAAYAEEAAKVQNTRLAAAMRVASLLRRLPVVGVLTLFLSIEKTTAPWSQLSDQTLLGLNVGFVESLRNSGVK
jgi:hypothetical protein